MQPAAACRAQKQSKGRRELAAKLAAKRNGTATIAKAAAAGKPKQVQGAEPVTTAAGDRCKGGAVISMPSAAQVTAAPRPGTCAGPAGRASTEVTPQHGPRDTTADVRKSALVATVAKVGGQRPSYRERAMRSTADNLKQRSQVTAKINPAAAAVTCVPPVVSQKAKPRCAPARSPTSPTAAAARQDPQRRNNGSGQTLRVHEESSKDAPVAAAAGGSLAVAASAALQPQPQQQQRQHQQELVRAPTSPANGPRAVTAADLEGKQEPPQQQQAQPAKAAPASTSKTLKQGAAATVGKHLSVKHVPQGTKQHHRQPPGANTGAKSPTTWLAPAAETQRGQRALARGRRAAVAGEDHVQEAPALKARAGQARCNLGVFHAALTHLSSVCRQLGLEGASLLPRQQVLFKPRRAYCPPASGVATANTQGILHVHVVEPSLTSLVACSRERDGSTTLK